MKKKDLIALIESLPGDEVNFFVNIHNDQYIKASPIKMVLVTNGPYKYLVFKDYYNYPEHTKILEGIILESNIR